MLQPGPVMGQFFLRAHSLWAGVFFVSRVHLYEYTANAA